MKKTVIVSTQPLGDVNISAFVRIMKFIAENVPNVEVIHEDFERYNKPIDNIVIAYGTFYADFKNMLTFLEKYNDKRFFYLINEYGLVPNGDIYRFLIKHDYEVIANYVKESQGAKHFVNHHMLNLNLTALRDVNSFPFEKREKRLIYWGTFRPDRSKYFVRYFSDITLSTSEKSKIKFFELLNNRSLDTVSMIDKVEFTDYSSLNHYKFSIYIEDRYTHTHFNHLADRFYEALSMGIITFFDISAKENVIKSGYNIKDFYFVSTREELEKKMREVEKNPSSYLKDLENLKEQTKKEKSILITKLSELLNSATPARTGTCPNCKERCYQNFKCEDCGKSICSHCMQIHKKHYCQTCFDKLNIEKELQTNLF